MKAKKAFDEALDRGEHLLTLYNLLRNRRSRAIRQDWATRLKTLMHWNQTEGISRVDGHRCMLILREGSRVEPKHFLHAYLSELLRSAVVAAVSAMDRYFHDSVVERSWTLLRKKEEDVPNGLKRLELPILETKKALEKLKTAQTSRPGTLIKKAIQDKLHNEFTFQNPNRVEEAAQMLGVNNFWREVANYLPGTPANREIMDRLFKIVRRRNQIVHEADIIRKTRARKLTLRDITHADARQTIDWIKDFIEATDQVFDNAAT